ncbi:MAG: hypothetical protein WDM79_00300 [Terricaulis sp.]
MAARLRDGAADILAANAEDVARGRRDGLAESFIDRLALDEARLESVAKGVDETAACPTRLARCWPIGRARMACASSACARRSA